MVSELQYDKIQALIEKGIEEGATLVAGGPGKPEGLNAGYFVKKYLDLFYQSFHIKMMKRP